MALSINKQKIGELYHLRGANLERSVEIEITDDDDDIQVQLK